MSRTDRAQLFSSGVKRRIVPTLTFVIGLGLSGFVLPLTEHSPPPPQCEAAAAPVTKAVPVKTKEAPPAPPAEGKLSIDSIWLTAPDHLVLPEQCPDSIGPWVLFDHTAPQLDRLLDAAHLEAAQRKELMETARCATPPAGRPVCVLRPELTLIESLSASSRAVLYAELARFDKNIPQFSAYRFSQEKLDDWRKSVDLSPGLLRGIDRLLYRIGDTVNLADLEVLCKGASTADRRALLRALSHTRSLIAKLEVAEGEDVEPLVSFYGVGGRANRVRPLLQALSARPGGGSIDISHLFPPFPRQRVYRYPDAGSPNYNCHWTSFNFFERWAPDDRLLRADGLDAVHEKFDAVDGRSPQFGDVISFIQPDGVALHSVVYITDDIVFTKNGLTHRSPFVLASAAEIRKEYRYHPEMREVYFRRRRP